MAPLGMPDQLRRQPRFPSELYFNILVIPGSQVQPWRCWHHQHSPPRYWAPASLQQCTASLPNAAKCLTLWRKNMWSCRAWAGKKVCADPWMGKRLSYSRDSRVCSVQKGTIINSFTSWEPFLCSEPKNSSDSFCWSHTFLFYPALRH